MSDKENPALPVTIEDEMRRSFIDYAMSVIIGRALPDVRDGMKPAHRRVIYGMRTMGLASNRTYRKCAKIVGEVMGNFHPHGDASIYDTLVRLAQPFNMRYPLVDSQGNFGSVDGDPPAAMRYTEARLDRLADDLMADLDKETVDFVPNYDETSEEPTVLPAPYPNLLVNGTSGIAVGMTTKIPPHNLREVIDGLVWVAEHATESDEEKTGQLLRIIPGPDLPTAGFIVGRDGIDQAYRTGRGSFTMRARTSIEAGGSGRTKKERVAIVVTEIPYQENKARLVEKIAELVRTKVIEGIVDLRDESDRDGMRIVIEIRRGDVPEVVLNKLYKHTSLQSSFGIIMLAIVAGRPQVLSLLELIEHFLAFRCDVVRRRTEHELRKAEARAHILEGLRVALDHLDAVIKLIRSAKSPAEARGGLIDQFELTQKQAQAILDMQLQRLTGLERQKIIDELAGLIKTIDRLRAILESEKLLRDIVVRELREIQEKYGDDRRTEIIDSTGEFRVEDLIAEEDMAITVSKKGYIKRTAIKEYRQQGRGGKGRIGMRTREEDLLTHVFVASTHDYILIFSDRGRVYWLKVHEIPDVGPAAQGKSVANLVAMAPKERIAALETVREFPEADGERFVVMGTRRGVIKKTDLHAFRNRRAGGVVAMGIDEKADDEVVGAELTDGQGEIFIGTRRGRAIRFGEVAVRPMGRTAYGVRGIRLRNGDEVVAMTVVHPSGTVLTVTENGYGKRTDLKEYRVQSRGGLGMINIQTSARNGHVAGITCVEPNDELILITQKGKMLRMISRDIRPIGRATQGVRLIEIGKKDVVVSMAKLVERDEETADDVEQTVESLES